MIGVPTTMVVLPPNPCFLTPICKFILSVIVLDRFANNGEKADVEINESSFNASISSALKCLYTAFYMYSAKTYSSYH